MHSLKILHMTAHRRPRVARKALLLTTLFIVVFQASVASAQITADDLADPSLTDAERKQAALTWLDKYLTDSELMRKEDMAKIRDAVEQMSPSQLEKWLEQTKQLWDYVESPQWQETKRWLKGFLRVQAMYSDKEIQQLRDDILNADSDQMLAILKRIQAKHDSLVWMHQASEQSRALEVKQRNTNVAQQAAAASRSRSSSSSSVPLFGAGFAKGQKPSKGYRPPAPLITSRQVARAATWRAAGFGGGWGGGF